MARRASIETVVRLLNVVAVKIPEQEAEWFHHLGEVMAERDLPRLSGRGTRSPTTKLAYSHVQATFDPDLYRLNVLASRFGLVCLTESQQEMNREQLTALAAATEEAADRLNEEKPELRWTAVVAPAGRSAGGDAIALSSRASIGGIEIKPHGEPYLDYLPPLEPHLSAWALDRIWPARVEGGEKGYDDRVVARGATVSLHQLCGVLSVASDCEWVLRDMPRPARWEPAVIPTRHPLLGEEGIIQVESGLSPQEVTIPDWCEDGWNRLAGDERLRSALATYQEGLSLQTRHPSFALIAFVACIEAVAHIIHPGPGARRRFVSTLETTFGGSSS